RRATGRDPRPAAREAERSALHLRRARVARFALLRELRPPARRTGGRRGHRDRLAYRERMSRRREAIAAVEGRCPRCGAPRERTQEYCVECGLRLPILRGAISALRRGWVRRLGWYPGDWVWVSLLTLLVAAAGAAGAIV